VVVIDECVDLRDHIEMLFASHLRIDHPSKDTSVVKRPEVIIICQTKPEQIPYFMDVFELPEKMNLVRERTQGT